MDSLPPYFNTGIFNTSAFYTEKDYLTKEEADKLYLSIGSGSNLYLTGITPGLVLGEKCVIPDINKDISGFLNLSATSSINVNRTTNGECFNFSNGTVSGAIHCLTNSSHIGTTTNHNFYIQSNGSNVLQCLTSGNVNIPAHNGSTLGLQLNGTLITATATELNYNDITTIGTAQASKTLVLDASRNIININSITTNFLNFGTITGSTTTSSITGYRLNLGQVVNNFGMVSICGSTAVDSQAWPNDNCILGIESSNTTSKIIAEINVSSGWISPSLSTNPLRIGTITNNDFVLFTNSTERCRLRANGAFQIASTLQVGDSTDTARLISALDSSMETDDQAYITFGKLNANGNQAELSFLYYSSNSNNNAITFGFYGAGNESMRMYKDKCLCINSTVRTYQSTNSRLNIVSPGSEWCSIFKTSTTGANQMIGFYSSADVKQGGISFGAGSTTFNTSSDYRLKKDITPLTNALYIVNQLNPVKFDWIESNTSDFGFIAHEIQEFIPNVVQGIKDEIDKEGNINPQSVDYGKITPILVSAIQELTIRLKNLEDFIATLDIEEVPI